MSTWTRALVFSLLLLGVIETPRIQRASAQEPAAKKKVSSDADLPRFSYPIAIEPSNMLIADDATFNAFIKKVSADVESVLAAYDIQDKHTQRHLLWARFDAQILSGDKTGALATLDRIKGLQEKPSAIAMSGLYEHAALQAWGETGTASGPAFEKSFGKALGVEVDALPWAVVQDDVKSRKAWSGVASEQLLVGDLKGDADQKALKSNSLDMETALQLLGSRVTLKIELPLEKAIDAELTRYIQAHNVVKPDIWTARDVTLTDADKLTPVRVGIWDSGVDTALYPKQLFTDPAPGVHGPHGLAFDTVGKIYAGDLQPLTAELKEAYPTVLKLDQGAADAFSLIDSPEATEYRKFLATTPPDEMAKFQKKWNFLGQWMHGTHVAGIAVRGNPAARLVVVQFNDALPDLPFAPTVEWANQFKADFLLAGDYFRARNVRVVNMSWADSVSEIEEWLTKTSADQNPDARKQFAAQIYSIWRDAIEGAMRRAPKTLFVCAAGNSNGDAGFSGDVPASLHLPNLVTVAAVDQAGDETNFTSYGDTVVLDADGFRIESQVPGGTRLKWSGTSMATPNVVNLAAKLIALDPSLTPEQTIALIKKAADASADGRRHLINPKATVALLKQPR